MIKGPIDARLGSPPTESGRDSDEGQATRHIERTFAISTTEVTIAQYLRFNPTAPRHLSEHAPENDCPVGAVTWFDAVRYCRWLSQEEAHTGRPNVLSAHRQDRVGHGESPTMCSRTGYRLPTEAEWEFACRAGTSSIRFFGHDPALLRSYAWYHNNTDVRSWPVGSLKPNGFGLFDIMGNVSEWCLDSYATNRAAGTEEFINRRKMEGSVQVATRGGGYNDSVRTLRSANRRPTRPEEVRTRSDSELSGTLELSK